MIAQEVAVQTGTKTDKSSSTLPSSSLPSSSSRRESKLHYYALNKLSARGSSCNFFQKSTQDLVIFLPFQFSPVFLVCNFLYCSVSMWVHSDQSGLLVSFAPIVLENI